MGFFDVVRTGERAYRVGHRLHGQLVRCVLRPLAPLPRGYLHLVEHVLMRANAERLAALERAGGYSNAATTTDTLTVVLRTPGTDPVALDELLAAPWTPEHLEVERRTIRQERALKVGPPGTPSDADAVLGDDADIDGFTYDTLLDLRPVLDTGWTTYTYRDAPAVPRPAPDWSPGRVRDLPTLLTAPPAELTADERLVRFLVHVVEVAAPAPRPWTARPDGADLVRAARAGTAAAYVDRHRETLLLRYRLRMHDLMTFDRELDTFLATGLEPLDVAAAFRELPWTQVLT